MAIIQAQGQGLNPFIEALVNKERLAESKEALKIDQARFKLEQERAAVETAGQQNILQNFLQGLAGGGQFEQQMVAQTPVLGEALSDQQLSPEELKDPRLLALAADISAARQTFMQGQAREDALRRITEEAGRLGDPTIVNRARIAFDLKSAGVNDSLVQELIPPDMKGQVDIQSARVTLRGLQSVEEADTFATAWLQRQGVLPEGVNLIPGAAKTLLTVSEARENDAIDWMQEGIDFIVGRVGDSLTGSMFSVNPDGTLSAGGGAGTAVEVDQAISEWRSIVEQYAPEAVRERVLGQLDSGIFERRLRTGRAIELATSIFSESGSTPEAISDVRSILGEEFTPSEVTNITNRAIARAKRDKP